DQARATQRGRRHRQNGDRQNMQCVAILVRNDVIAIVSRGRDVVVHAGMSAISNRESISLCVAALRPSCGPLRRASSLLGASPPSDLDMTAPQAFARASTRLSICCNARTTLVMRWPVMSWKELAS